MPSQVDAHTGPNPHENADLDTNLYSRQIGTFGLETMRLLSKLKVLIIGLDSIGIECAKNIVLAGPHTVCVYDETIVKPSDLSANFFVHSEDVGVRSRSAACLEEIKQLNQYVQVSRLEGSLELENLDMFNVVVCSVGDLRFLESVNKYCREHSPPIGFISSRVFGACGYAFVDFGPKFVVHDKNGEDLKTAIICGISKEEDAVVTIHNDRAMPFETGDVVVFSEIEGMAELNGQTRKLKVQGNHTFVIGDTSSFEPYTREGIATEVKVPVDVHFKSLEACMSDPIGVNEFCLNSADMAKIGRPEQLHLAIRALAEYECDRGCLPDPHDTEAIQWCKELANQFVAESKRNNESSGGFLVEELDENVVENVVRYAPCVLTPLSSFLGGVISQEIVKFTGKYTPLHQLLYIDCFELLPSPAENFSSSPLDFNIYGSQIALWGPKFQEALANLRIFMVGAGALGCEFIKSLALLGCFTGENGKLTITDMDQIETSNLNRQFLFRKEHVGKGKSKTAAEAAKKISPTINIDAKEDRVGVETEEEFNDNFWESQDIILNALDNVQSRQYVDSRCVWYKKPLLESGTLGTRANVQVIIPSKTQSYNDSQDPPEQSIPLCTLKHFPNAIEHTIQWARDNFQGVFTDGPCEAMRFKEDPVVFLEKLKSESTSLSLQQQRLQNLFDILLLCEDEELILQQCIYKACDLFQDWFCNKILRLLHAFPEHHVTSSGQPFWSGPKRAPLPLNLDVEDEMTFLFVKSTANILAVCVGCLPCHDDDFIKRVASSHKLEEFQPIEMKLEMDDGKESIVEYNDDESTCSMLEKKIISCKNYNRVGFQQSEFEKDDDTNFHVAFIMSCANLRARNYRIGECDMNKAKMIAGRIIPAVATTTAMICGLVCMELLKIVKYEMLDKLEESLTKYKNSFVSLADCLWLLTEPLPPVRTTDKDFDPIACGPLKAIPNGFTTWDRLEVNFPNGTIRQLMDYLDSQYNVDVGIISVGNSCLYNAYLPKHKKTRLDRPIQEVTQEVCKVNLPSGRKYVVAEVSCNDKRSMIDVILPPIRFQFA